MKSRKRSSKAKRLSAFRKALENEGKIQNAALTIEELSANRTTKQLLKDLYWWEGFDKVANRMRTEAEFIHKVIGNVEPTERWTIKKLVNAYAQMHQPQLLVSRKWPDYEEVLDEYAAVKGVSENFKDTMLKYAKIGYNKEDDFYYVTLKEPMPPDALIPFYQMMAAEVGHPFKNDFYDVTAGFMMQQYNAKWHSRWTLWGAPPSDETLRKYWD